MEKYGYRLLLLFVLNVYGSNAYTYDFEVDGICYNIIPNKSNEVEVTAKRYSGLNVYSGDVTIPPEITYSGNKYVVTAIGDATFRGSNIKSVTLPNTIVSIGEEAFDYCIKLKTVTLDKSLKEIGKSSFSRCGMLESFIIPNSVENIGDYAFYECTNILSIDIPNSVNSIGNGAFCECTNLKSTTLSQNLSSINDKLFYDCISLESIDIPNSVKSIGREAFCRCRNLKVLKNSSSLETIGTLAFEECWFLSSITFPSSLKSIGSQAFYSCPSLSSIISELTDPFELPSNFFYVQPGLSIQIQGKTLTIPSGTKQKYTDMGWTGYFNNVIELAAKYDFTIVTMGNGSVTYNNSVIREGSNTFIIEEGTSVTLNFTPDNGFRIKSVKVNNTDVTSSVSNNSYTISNISASTKLDVKFEAIPPTTYILSISSTGSGYASYDGTTIRSKTCSFTVNEGTSATISFTPDYGYRIKSVKVNSTNVTSSVSNNQYTVSNIQANTTVEVEFEAIPPTTYTLSISATGSGYASYDGTTIRSKTSTFTVNEGTNATISFSADNGYRIKTVKVNGLTVNVTNNQYTISSINANTTVVVEFEAIPPTTYTLSITAAGNGSASYNGTTIRSTTSSFIVNEGESATITFSPDYGYRIKSVKVNGYTISSIVNYQYTINSISSNTTISVEFEAIPPTTYTLSVTAIGNGSASYGGTTIRGRTTSFTMNEGTSATITFTPDNGYRIKGLEVNGATVSVTNDQYTISSINANTTVEVVFVEIPSGFTVDGVNYTVTSFGERQVKVTGGNYGNVLTVPATVTYQDETWKVVGIESGTLANNSQLAAVIWEPEAAFTESVSNPNLLLYVKSAGYAPVTIRNVVVNGTASNIILTDATNGNDFYCPQEFTARKISYTHNYSMATGIGESKGWESIALPFDVAKTVHASKGEIVPYQKWDGTDSKKPFWLMELGASGFVKANAIKANTPYIISMPNHQNYREDYRLNGSITFSAENVRVKRTDDLSQASSGDKTFVPNFTNRQGTGIYALNVNNDYVTYSGGTAAGSRFVTNLRALHPFEAYMTSVSAARTIVISDNMVTGIDDISVMIDEKAVIRVYLPSGQLVVAEKDKSLEEIKAQLPAGVYIVNGQKLIIK